MTLVAKLVAIGSDPLGDTLRKLPKCLEAYPRGNELFEMLKQKNGFYAFEQALHVFPVDSGADGVVTVEGWNSETLWRSAYGNMTRGLLFFAEDVLGDQFCVSTEHGAVSRFVAETGELTPVAESVEEWASVILSNYRIETGWPLAHEWQEKHGLLPSGQRLQPKIPFVLGGKYEIDNLWAGDAVTGMRFKADLAMKMTDLPDGTRINLQPGNC